MRVPWSTPSSQGPSALLIEIGCKRPAKLGGACELVPIVLVIDAERQRSARFQCRPHRGVELEAQEVHGRGLGIVAALEILVGVAKHAPQNTDLEIYGI